jgi:hypothetical protein
MAAKKQKNTVRTETRVLHTPVTAVLLDEANGVRAKNRLSWREFIEAAIAEHLKRASAS